MKPTCLFPIFLFCLLSCHSGKITVQQIPSAVMNAPSFMPGPQAIVYKTTRDYYNNIPVIMNEAHTEIISYPSPTDIYFNGELALPTRLADGYLLDNRGIGANVAFLDYTYEEYRELDKTPDSGELVKHIIDKDPLVEAWNCGLRSQYKDEVQELNQRIKSGFAGCKALTEGLILKQPQ